MTNSILVVDLEATCWPKGKIPEGQQTEIIEIGLAVVKYEAITDASGFYYGSMGDGSIFVKPNSEISPFCTDLTGITAETVSGGLSFEEAMHLLKSHKETPWASWGDWDRKQLRRECKRNGIGFPLSYTHLNIKNWWAVLSGQGPMWIKDAAAQWGLQFIGTPHRGSDDALTAAMILAEMLKRFGRTS